MRRWTGLIVALATWLVLAQLAPSAMAQGKDGLKFELYKDAKEEFRWRLKAADGKVIATAGQGYKAKADCQHGIEVIQEAGDAKSKATFEVYEDNKKEFRWRLKASNGQVMAGAPEGFKAKADCEAAVALVKSASKAPIEDLTKK